LDKTLAEPMTGLNVRLGGSPVPITVRMPRDLKAALDEASNSEQDRSHIIRKILVDYLDSNDVQGETTYERLHRQADKEHRSPCGLIRNVLRLDMANRGYLKYHDVPARMSL
jgi:predicted transcriptional regulator